MIVSIHQPNFLPWMGFFYKIVQCDVFVLLDSVQFTKNSFINRNKIKTSQGVQWLTVPVSVEFGQMIEEVRINNEFDWRKKHLKTLQMNYARSEFFEEVFNALQEVYFSENFSYLSNLNVRLIEYVMSYLDIEAEVLKASEMDIGGKAEELLINIVKKVGGDVYLSGAGGSKYQNEAEFKDKGIELRYSVFEHPIYKQLWGDFVTNLSVLDILFNCGKYSRKIILESQP